ncbi:MAG: hypothetical protein HY392_04490 [Candidatus Diapherotrites archaeon]|nr:hypothetical protein [Candidatus Diapherotrites archaeon]
MTKRPALFFFLVLLFSQSVFSEDFGSVARQAAVYAEQYENNQINYLQLQVYLNFLREKIYQEFFETNETSETTQPDPSDALIFSLFEEAKNAYDEGDFEKLNLVFDKLEIEFSQRGEQGALALLNGMKEALRQGDARKLEELVGKLEDIFKEGKRRDEFVGWSREKAESFFGEPTLFQDRVWVENLKRDVKIEEPVPAWEKTVFDGQKIKLVFSAWPHLTEYSDEIVAYYWVNLETKFKKNISTPDPSEVISQAKEKIQSFSQTGAGGQELGEFLVYNERLFNDLLRENNAQCNETMLGFFENTTGNSSKIKWSGTFFESDNLTIILNVHEVVDEQWHGFNSWFEINSPQWEGGTPQHDFDYENAHAMGIAQNTAELKSFLDSMKREAQNNNMAFIQEKNNLIGDHLNVLTEKANKEQDFSTTELQSLLESLFTEYTTDFQKEQVKATDYVAELLKVSEERTNSYCRDENKWCGESFSCFNAACVSAKGGNEVCNNSVDDDSDNVIDCNDPDCIEFLECGRVCEPVCNTDGGCWQCHSENCRSECDACGECNENNPDNPRACDSVCQSCGSCAQANCSNVCDSCWSCENTYFGDGCYDECKSCNECNSSGNTDCSSSCTSCNNCQFEAGDFSCESGKTYSREAGYCVCEIQQCPEGQFFDQGDCSCRAEEQRTCDLQCGEGQVLNQDACVCETVPQECNLQCNEGEILNQDACVCEPVQEECNLQCGEGEILNTETCQCEAGEGGLSGPLGRQEGVALFSPVSLSLPSGFATLVEQNSSEASAPSFLCENITCSANQFCNTQNGFCDCQQGFWDCDGDWVNGCESSSSCKPCASDSDCAAPRCSQDGFSIDTFKCEQGESWEETTMQFEFRGVCEQKTSGEIESNVWFGGWGGKFDELERFKQMAYQKFESDWCREELEQEIQERLELQNSFNQEFLDWFFSEFVTKNPSEFSFQGESLRFVYEAFQRNSEDTARHLRCLHRNDWPAEFTPVNISTESPIGKIRFWEELKQTNFWGESQQIMSPYMEAWFFPTKDEFKTILAQEASKEGPKGPSPVEVEQMRQDPRVSGTIQRISDSFGGDARVLFLVSDNGEAVFRMLLQVNPQIMVRMDFPQEQPQDVDATVSMSYDFFYETMSTIMKDLEGSQISRPFWEENDFRPPEVDDAFIIIGLFTKIILGIPFGQVQIEPLSAVPSIILTLGDMVGLMQLK